MSISMLKPSTVEFDQLLLQSLTFCQSFVLHFLTVIEQSVAQIGKPHWYCGTNLLF